MNEEDFTPEQKKIMRLMRVSAEMGALSSFQALIRGHAWAAPPTEMENRAAKLVSEAQSLLLSQLMDDEEGLLPED